jgi:integrase
MVEVVSKTTVVERHTHPKHQRLQVHLRSDSRFFQAVTFIDNKTKQKSLKVESLTTALRLAEEWYRGLLKAEEAERRKHPLDTLGSDSLMADVCRAYQEELTPSRRAYAAMKWSTIKSFWGPLVVTDITPQTFKEFYAWRRKTKTPAGTVIKPHSLHKDVMVIRQILKFAIEEGHLQQLPLIPKVGTIVANPRPWLTPDEWKQLIAVGEARILEAADNRQERVLEQRGDLQEFMQAMVGSMCRVGELLSLRYCDCLVEPATHVLTAHVTGKRGARTIKAPAAAGRLVAARRARFKPAAEALVFPVHHREGFKELLKAAKLYRDSAGFTRNLKSLRATAISFRILQGRPTPNLLAIARNAGTSVSMIDQFYARRMAAELFTETLSVALDDVVGDSLV